MNLANINDSWLEEQQMSEFFNSNVAEELIDDTWTDNRDMNHMILPEFELISSMTVMTVTMTVMTVVAVMSMI